jgi:hypothetical protein
VPEKAVRFAISDMAGHRAACWKLFSSGKKSDVYLTCRELGKMLKASIHESGACHVAFTRQAFEKRHLSLPAGQTDRFIQKWPRPDPLGGGVTLVYRILTSQMAVCAPTAGDKRDTIYVPNCVPGYFTEVAILLTSGGATLTDWPGKNRMGTALIGSYPLGDTERVWAVYRTVPVPTISPEQGTGQLPIDVTFRELRSAQKRAFIFGDQPDGSRVILETIVKACRETQPRPTQP